MARAFDGSDRGKSARRAEIFTVAFGKGKRRGRRATGTKPRIKANFCDELSNASLTTARPLIERTMLALNDTDARRRNAAADAMLDGILQIVGDTHRRLLACDEFEDN